MRNIPFNATRHPNNNDGLFLNSGDSGSVGSENPKLEWEEGPFRKNCLRASEVLGIGVYDASLSSGS